MRIRYVTTKGYVRRNVTRQTGPGDHADGVSVSHKRSVA